MKQRAFEFDFIRCIAILMVVGVHCVPPVAETVPAHLYNSFMYAVLFIANALFFLMSGFFNIKDSYNLPSYYRKKIRNILIPTLIYMLIYEIWYRISFGGSDNPLAVQYLLDVFSSYQNGVFWFVMSLFGMLLLAPIIAPAFRSMLPEKYHVYIFLTLFFLTLSLIGSIIGHPSGWPYPFGIGFALFCFGAAFHIEKASANWTRYLWLALLCTLVSTYLNFNGVPNANDASPFFAVASVSVYVLLYSWGRKAKHSKCISFIAKYSFGIYMLHIPVLQTIQPLMPALSRPVAHLALLVVVMLVTLPLVFLVDKTIVKIAQSALDRIHMHKVRTGESANDAMRGK